MKTSYIAILAAAAILSAPASANLLVNGGFDLDDVPATGNSGFKNYGDGAALGGGGWTAVSATTNLSTTYVEGGIGFPSQAGANALDLTGPGTQGPGPGVRQLIDTLAGQIYSLSFWLGNGTATAASGRAGFYAGPASLTLSIGGGAATTYTNALVSEGSVVWQQFSTSFVGTGGATSILFANATPSTDNYTGLDSVELLAVAGGVPEPATWATLVGGFAVTGLALRRRRRIGLPATA